MKSSEAGFRKIAPWIDRAFRFIEMIGITALLSVIIPEISTPVQYGGTALALYYLFEPSIDAFAYWLIPEVSQSQDILRITVVTSIMVAATFLSTSVVVGLAARVSHTISLKS